MNVYGDNTYRIAFVKFVSYRDLNGGNFVQESLGQQIGHHGDLLAFFAITRVSGSRVLSSYPSPKTNGQMILLAN